MATNSINTRNRHPKSNNSLTDQEKKKIKELIKKWTIIDRGWRNLAKMQATNIVKAYMHKNSHKYSNKNTQKAISSPLAAHQALIPKKIQYKSHKDLFIKILWSPIRGDPGKPCTQGVDKTNCRVQKQGSSHADSQPTKPTQK